MINSFGSTGYIPARRHVAHSLARKVTADELWAIGPPRGPFVQPASTRTPLPSLFDHLHPRWGRGKRGGEFKKK